MIINVHAGHNPDGCVGCGAIGYIKESTEARKVTAKVISFLKDQGHTVYDCTVNDGKERDILEKIVSNCNAHDAYLNISIHFNAGSKDKDRKTTGTEVLIYSTSSQAADPARRVVAAIANLGFTNRGIVVRPDLYVLKHTKAPTILVECCFTDDKDDVNLYDADKMAAAIVAGVLGADFKTETANYTAICGKSQATVAQMQAYLRKVNPVVPVSVLSMLPLYISEGEAEGIRGDIAFAQSCLETGNFVFKPTDTAVRLSQNNFCGMGVTSYGVKGSSFSTPQQGIRAQIQHLKAYSCKAALVNACVDPRFSLVSRGIAPYVQWLGAKENPTGSGWAAGADYGAKILRILTAVVSTDAISATSTTTPAVYDGFYRVRTNWADLNSQKGAFTVFSNAKECCDKYAGTIIFTDSGVPVYPVPFTVSIASDKAYYTSFDGKTKAGTAKKGTYTIVEVDAASGYGKLKSGAGWMPLSGVSICATKTVTPGEKVVKAGKEMAAYMTQHGYRYKKKKDAGFKVTETIATSFRKSVSSKNPTCHCTGGASWAFQLAGYLKEGYIIGHHLENKEHLIGCEILHPNKTGKQLIAEKYLKPGDFVLSSKDTCDGNTACIFAGYDNGKKYWLEWGGPFKGKNCKGGTGENRNDYINIGPIEIPYDETHTIQHVIRPVGDGNGGIDISSIIK